MFNKMLLINISETSIEKDYWDEIDMLCKKKVFFTRDSKEILQELADTDGILVNFGTAVNKEDIDNAPNLKYIGCLATAFGKIDVDYAAEKNIPVCNLAGYSTEAVAEFTVAAILEQIRSLEEGKTRGRKGNYSEEGIHAWELKGKKFGVLGLGSIGRRVAELVQGFGCDVRYYSRNRKHDAETKGINYHDADSLISESDFISINLAQTEKTENFLNTERINSIKANAVVINTAPMELVDIDALAKRLAKKDIIFIMDHADETDLQDMEKLRKHSNCIIYPPIAYITDEASVIKQKMFVDNIKNFLKGNPTNRVN